MPGGEGFEEQEKEEDELLSHAAAVQLVRERASLQRGRSEPDVPLPAGPREGRLPLTLPDPNLGGGARALVKRSIARLTRWQLAPLLRQLNDVRAEQQEKMAAQEARSAELAQKLADQRLRAEQLAASLEAVKQALDRKLTESWRPSGPPDQGGMAHRGLAQSGTAQSGAAHDGGAELDALYEAHQERFRGTRESVLRRLDIYLPHVQEVATPDQPVLDLGPGRGEWLSLLRANGVAAYGVDANSAFVAGAADQGLDVLLGDAVEHLRSLPDRSLSAVTAFHLVEHLPTPALVDLVENAQRALRPGGLLILESPNPLNLRGAADFHLDPTHQRPVHPHFLEFLLENRGFAEVRITVVNPPEDPPLELDLSSDGGPETLARMAGLLNEAFFAGLDYAVIGRRADPSQGGPGSPGHAPEPGAGPLPADGSGTESPRPS